MKISTNKRYEMVNLAEENTFFSSMYYQDYSISQDILQKLSKDLGFSHSLYLTLWSIADEAASNLVTSMSKQSNHEYITFILDDDKHEVVGYSLESPRTPLLNSDFIKRSLSLLESSDVVSVSDVYYLPDDIVSSILIKKLAPIVVEEKYEGRDSKFIEYQVGVLLTNDETNSSYARLAIYIDGNPVYLPSSYYSATSTRYRRSTENSNEALEVLILKIIEDLRDGGLDSRVYDFHYKYRVMKDIIVSYEEFNTLLRSMRRIPSVIDDPEVLSPLLSRVEDFEKRYLHLEDKKSSYIWRCTAMSQITMNSLVSLSLDILRSLNAPMVEYYEVREILGNYISTPRIATDIAVESID